jgi:hypothetical protein
MARRLTHRGVAVTLILAAGLLSAACRRHPRAHITADQAVAARQRRGLERMVAKAATGPLMPVEEVLVVVDQSLVQDLLGASLPYERVISGKYRVRVITAGVTFDDGAAVVRLEGRASLAAGGEAGAFADVTVVGSLDIVELDPSSGILRGRVRIIAVEARRVDVLGVRAPAERLVEDLSREGVEAFNVLASSIEIPVRLEREVTLPAVGPEGGVRIAAAAVPVRLAVVGLNAFRGKLWVSIDAVAGAAAEAPRPSEEAPPAPDTAPASQAGESADAQARAALRGRVQELVDADPFLTEVLADPGQVVVAVHPALVEDLIQEVAARYLDRVDLDLDLGVDFHEGREVKVRTFLGKLKAGRWDVDVTVGRVRGVLQARSPRVRLDGGSQVRLAFAVLLREAHGTAGVHFKWDAGSLAGAVCHDFEVRKRFQARVLPEEYAMAGALRISSAAGVLVGQPLFPATPFRLRVDLAPESWAEVRRELEEQDRPLRCGMALDPDEMLAKLKELLHTGFDVKLPRSLFRTVELPAHLTQEVTVEGQRVELEVRTNDLRVTPRAFWYSAAVRSRPHASAATPPARPGVAWGIEPCARSSPPRRMPCCRSATTTSPA